MHQPTHRKIVGIASSLALATLGWFTPVAAAIGDEKDAAEIEHLLEVVGTSGCTFIRNGKRHSAADAEDHLRMKYGKTRRYIDTAEEFIDKLASESSWTGKPYVLECPDSDPAPSQQWLKQELAAYRSAN